MARDPIPVAWGRRQFSGHGVVAPAAASRQDSPQSDSRAQIRMKHGQRSERVRLFSVPRRVAFAAQGSGAGGTAPDSIVYRGGRACPYLTFRVQLLRRDRVRGDAG